MQCAAVKQREPPLSRTRGQARGRPTGRGNFSPRIQRLAAHQVDVADVLLRLVLCAVQDGVQQRRHRRLQAQALDLVGAGRVSVKQGFGWPAYHGTCFVQLRWSVVLQTVQ